MSWKILELVYGTPRPKPAHTSSHLNVLAYIAFRQNHVTGEAFPATATIAAAINHCHRHTRRLLDDLEAVGVIRKTAESRGHDPPHYTVVVERLLELRREGAQTPSKPAREGVHRPPLRGGPHVRQRGSTDPPNRKEPKEEQPKDISDGPSPAYQRFSRDRSTANGQESAAVQGSDRERNIPSGNGRRRRKAAEPTNGSEPLSQVELEAAAAVTERFPDWPEAQIQQLVRTYGAVAMRSSLKAPTWGRFLIGLGKRATRDREFAEALVSEVPV